MTTRIDEIGQHNWKKWEKAVSNVTLLRELDNIDDPQKLKEKFRLLPLTPLMLFAYTYQEDRLTIDRWKIFKHLDKAFTTNNLTKIHNALKRTIVKLKEIAELRKISWAICNQTLDADAKWNIYMQNPHHLEKIKNRVLTTVGLAKQQFDLRSAKPNADHQAVSLQLDKDLKSNECKSFSNQNIVGQIEIELKSGIAAQQYKEVVDKMIWVIKHNYNCPLNHDIFQKDCQTCKKEEGFFFQLL